jgi:hypothetical protein
MHDGQDPGERSDPAARFALRFVSDGLGAPDLACWERNAARDGRVLSRNRRDREEVAFLPAALEIMETPPSPLGRAVAVTIAGVCCLALAWACLGRIDIVASASGKIIASDRTKVVQPFETGVVRAIHVRDGQNVKSGDVLIELDPTMNEAERDHLRSDSSFAGAAARARYVRAKIALALDDPEQVGGLALIAPVTHQAEQVPPPFDGLAIGSPLLRRLIAWTAATPLSIANRERALTTLFGPRVPDDFATRGGGAIAGSSLITFESDD